MDIAQSTASSHPSSDGKASELHNKGQAFGAELKDSSVSVPTSSVTKANAVDSIPTTGVPDVAADTDFPEGGTRAWLTVAGAWCVMFVSFGMLQSVGVFQAYWELNQLRAYSHAEVAWIVSLSGGCLFIGGLVVGPLYDRYGPHYLLAAGTTLNVLGLMMSSISKRYYQFLLSQGLCSGIGSALLFFPAVSCVITYFNAKRATALGIATSGAGVGGVVMPLIFHEMVDDAGYGWTLRTIAFIVLLLGVVAQLTITSRLPPTPKKASAKEMVATLKDRTFLLVTLAGFAAYLTIFTGNTFIVVTAINRGVDISWSFYLVPILNTGSFFGRLLPGPLADKMGMITMFTVMTLLTFLVLACVWIPVSGTAGMVMFAILFGFTTGCILSLAPGVVSLIGDMKTLGLRMGVIYMVAGISTLFGSPLGGAIITGSGYRAMQGYTAAVAFVNFLLACAVRYSMVGWKMQKV